MTPVRSCLGQATSSACSVDVSAVWWGATGPAEVCIAVACEASVSLWRQLGVDRWEVLHTWHFAEVGGAAFGAGARVSLRCLSLAGTVLALPLAARLGADGLACKGGWRCFSGSRCCREFLVASECSPCWHPGEPL